MNNIDELKALRKENRQLKKALKYAIEVSLELINEKEKTLNNKNNDKEMI